MEKAIITTLSIIGVLGFAGLMIVAVFKAAG
jgi:hypothetical protein